MKARSKILEVNLRQQMTGIDLQSNIERQLDQVFYPYLQKSMRQFGHVAWSDYNLLGITIRLVVGKGLKSKTLIQGKHPVRFYTENYLNRLGVSYREADYWSGQEGVLEVNM